MSNQEVSKAFYAGVLSASFLFLILTGVAGEYIDLEIVQYAQTELCEDQNGVSSIELDPFIISQGVKHNHYEVVCESGATFNGINKGDWLEDVDE